METTSGMLRRSTADLHARVDGRVRDLLGRGDAGRMIFLRASAEVVVPWERELRRFAWPERTLIDERLRKSSWLAHDLGELDSSPLRAQAASLAEAWGALYVFEGSTLGATVIRRMVPAPAPRYLEAYGDATRDMWSRMQGTLDDEVRDDDARDACLRGAQRVFSQFGEALERHA